MTIADRINEMYTHIGDVYDTITNVDLPTNKNIQNIPSTMRNSYLEIMNNGIDKIWDNWEKVVGEGTTITLNNTEEAPMKINLKGNTSQEGTPTPEAPQPIHVVSGDNSIVVCGKNLVFSKIANENISRGGLLLIDNSFDMHIAKVTQGETYTITTNDATNGFVGGFFYDLPKNNMFTYNNQRVVQDNNKIFTAPITGYVAFRSQAGYEYAQLEKGTTASEFEPYKGASYPVSLGNIELLKIGTYQDSIVKDNGKWYLNKQIGKVVLDGSENLITYATSTSGYLQMRYNGIISSVLKPSSPSIKIETLCNRYVSKTSNDTYLKNQGVSISTFGSVDFYDETYHTSVDDYKIWLATNNVILYYPLATPTYTEITDSTLLSQLNALAKSYASQTNISQESNDLASILNATALEEMS